VENIMMKGREKMRNRKRKEKQREYKTTGREGEV
jgi:hypothetical protein